MDKIKGAFEKATQHLTNIFPTAQKSTAVDVRLGAQILREYKNGKSFLEARIVEDEQWWKLRHWEVMNKDKGNNRPEPVSAWLFNSITSKHADAMDGFPEASVLPREESDSEEAKKLSGVLPAIMEYNEFEETYSNNWWYKLKHGCCAYGVFWNSETENGLGDIQIKKLDLLNIFWEPGVTDIQKSRNLFIVDLRDNDILESEYPALRGKSQDNAIDIKQYIYDDSVDTSKKSLVVDWYYKVRSTDGRTLLHYCKFVGDTVLFSSEEHEEYQSNGWYDHGKYPIVFDTLFPEEGTPVGFGYIAVTKDPQMYIDKLNQAILENAMMAARPRYFSKISAGVNEAEFLDWNKPIVHVEGDINDERLQPINVNQLPASCVSILKMKIDELKETSSNTEFTRGNTHAGITAAAAIEALQEAGGKTSRDMLMSTYRAFVKINYLCIELIRQFYDELRSFRITAKDGTYKFTDYSNVNIKRYAYETESGNEIYRQPVFDICVKAQKKSPYNKLSQNETAKELFKIGFFDPQASRQALCALELMSFEGKAAVEEKIRENAQLFQERMEEYDANNNQQKEQTI